MSSSSSSLPQPAYTRPVRSQPPSDGSFGPLFIVLGMIAVLSVIACAAGRFCARKLSDRPTTTTTKATHEKPAAGSKGDVEGGYAAKVPVMKPAAHMMKQNKINPGASELESNAVNTSYMRPERS